MNKDDLEKLLGKLPDDVQIIEIKTADDIKYFPKDILEEAERVTTKDSVIVFLRRMWKGVKRVGTVWVVALALFPEIAPTPIKVIQVAAPKIQQVVAKIDFSFPYEENLGNRPFIEFPNLPPSGTQIMGTTYQVPPIGISPDEFDSLT